MAKLLLILLLSTLFINTATFLVVLSDDPESIEEPGKEKKPDPVGILKPQNETILKAIGGLRTELNDLSNSQKIQLSGITQKMQTLEAAVKALSEPLEEEEPAENTGGREFKKSRLPADGK